ncbi:hypothetical protein QAD02_011847 [Eretmocerus hayati]|uniref:Uncharacterized protein n=1 Tax=Eretmocerus hayati TaxID=131215 RepID=A0ACC2NZP3_9HYME|nr:hypothetical protein QAD02_011847 [Eretmocerus hayati]
MIILLIGAEQNLNHLIDHAYSKKNQTTSEENAPCPDDICMESGELHEKSQKSHEPLLTENENSHETVSNLPEPPGVSMDDPANSNEEECIVTDEMEIILEHLPDIPNYNNVGLKRASSVNISIKVPREKRVMYKSGNKTITIDRSKSISEEAFQ